MTRYIPAVMRHNGKVETTELLEKHKTRNDAAFSLGLWLGSIGPDSYKCAAVIRNIDGNKTLVYEVGDNCDDILECLS